MNTENDYVNKSLEEMTNSKLHGRWSALNSHWQWLCGAGYYMIWTARSNTLSQNNHVVLLHHSRIEFKILFKMLFRISYNEAHDVSEHLEVY